MLPPFFTQPRRRRRTSKRAVSAPAALTLIAAVYEDSAWVRLTFDQPIDVASCDPSQITVDDGVFSQTRWAGITALLIAPNIVKIDLEASTESTQSGILLFATNINGIIAADDAQPWAGVSDYPVTTP